MRSRKLFAGARVREVRQSHKLTQSVFAERMGISTSYLNQIENNQRPLSASVVLALAESFQLDVATLAAGEAGRIGADLREALADPLFGDAAPSLQEIETAAGAAPAFAHAFLTLHRAYTRANERLAGLGDALTRDDSTLAPLPYEEVRDFFHYHDNYVDRLDRAAEAFAGLIGLDPRERLPAAIRALKKRDDVRVVFGGAAQAPQTLRAYDPKARVLSINAALEEPTQLFQIAHQAALIEQVDLIETLLDEARFETPDAREIGKMGLANYFAGAVVLPYAPFLAAARETRHDLELLAHRFRASVEQVAQRLSTLQRRGVKGVPFFFVRVDQAGTVTKRHSATPLQFARFGGACPLWNVHRAFEIPGRIDRQLAETPDGVRYICLARTVTKRGGSFHSPTRRYAIGLGCEIKHAAKLVYADDLDVARDAAFEPIGISCRICERAQCHQRAVPPLEKAIRIDHNRRDVVPFALDKG